MPPLVVFFIVLACLFHFKVSHLTGAIHCFSKIAHLKISSTSCRILTNYSWCEQRVLLIYGPKDCGKKISSLQKATLDWWKTHIWQAVYSVVTRLFGAQGQKQWSSPPQSCDVGITPTVRFSVKGTLWLPEFSFFCKVTTSKLTAKLHQINTQMCCFRYFMWCT